MDAAEVLKLKSEQETLWSGVRGMMEEVLSLYELTYDVPVEKGFNAYRPPTGARIVDTAIDHILVGNEVITVPPRKETKEAQTQADKLERFYRAEAIMVDKDLPDPLLRSLARNALLFGLGVSKGPFWDEQTPDKPTRGKKEKLAAYRERVAQWENSRRGAQPIILRLVDSLQVLYPLDIFPPPYVIETGKRTVGYLRQSYSLPLEGAKDTDEVEWVEYWDKEQRLFLAGGISVLGEDAQQNIGGFIPYDFVYSGLGRVPAGKSDSTAIIRSILEPVRQALKQEATLLTALDVIVQLHAYPRYVGPKGQLHLIDWESGPGGMLGVPEGFKLTLLEMPKALPDMYNRLSILRKEIEDATFSGVIQGNPPQGVEAGYAVALLVGQARMKFGALIGNLERARENMLSKVGQLIEALDETVTVWAQTPKGNIDETIKAEDFKGHRQVYVTLSGVSPEEGDRRTMLGLNLRKSREISQQTLLEKYVMLPDVTTERERLLVEELLENPDIKNILAQEALKAWADEETLQAIEEAKQKAQAQPGQIAPSPEMVGGGSGMPGLTPQPPGVPPRPAQAGSPEEMPVWLKRLRRGGVASQAQPLGGPREVVE